MSKTWLVGIHPVVDGKTNFHTKIETKRFTNEDEAYTFQFDYNKENYYGTPIFGNCTYAFVFGYEEGLENS